MNKAEKKKKQQLMKQTTKKRKSRSQKNNEVTIVLLNHDSLFGIILAAICSSKKSRDEEEEDVIKKCLNELHLSLPQNFSTLMLSLLPPLLHSKCDEIVCKTAEIVGSASLTSLEMNEMIASQSDIIKCLISLLKHSNEKVQIVACNAILDLSTTYTGRFQLVQFLAIETLIVCFIQDHKLPSPVYFLWYDDEKADETNSRIDFCINKAGTSVLHAIILLINSCTIKQLQEIPKTLSAKLLAYLNNLWKIIHWKLVCHDSYPYIQGQDFYVSNIRVKEVSETIFRLSMNNDEIRESSQLNIFHPEKTSFEHFVSNHWETLPLLMKEVNEPLNGIFSSFLRLFNSREEIYSSVRPILNALTSCPPINSDELEILHFLTEVSLGNPLIYQQDIRVVKVNSETESHYFQTRSNSPHVMTRHDFVTCEEAFKNGYTIALRGMEFRYKSIASIAEELAIMFGQPSAGVNMYLTPPNSQGLACHKDDHCVFVFQLIGTKQWKIYPRLSTHLPRLYDPVDNSNPCHVNEDGEKILLKEGDVLYIPRGSPHEANTIINSDMSDKIAESSLHMTLSIEVEPPFEWEGFIHVALHNWVMKQNKDSVFDSHSTNLHFEAMKLIHVAVKLMADQNPYFRKACLVGAIGSSLFEEKWLEKNQKMIFNTLLSTIDTDLNFSNALKHVEESITKDEDPFQEVRWLENLMEEEETIESYHWHIAFADACDCFSTCNQQIDMVEGVFMEVKCRFCSEVVFEDVKESYRSLLHKFRKVRKQYSNGMLSLHCTKNKDGEPL